MAMLKLLERMKRSDLTVHGFRSSFRDWVEEQTAFPGSVVEAALAHALGTRSSRLSVRRRLIREARLVQNFTPCRLKDQNGN